MKIRTKKSFDNFHTSSRNIKFSDSIQIRRKNIEISKERLSIKIEKLNVNNSKKFSKSSNYKKVKFENNKPSFCVTGNCFKDHCLLQTIKTKIEREKERKKFILSELYNEYIKDIVDSNCKRKTKSLDFTKERFDYKRELRIKKYEEDEINALNKERQEILKNKNIFKTFEKLDRNDSKERVSQIIKLKKLKESPEFDTKLSLLSLKKSILRKCNKSSFNFMFKEKLKQISPNVCFNSVNKNEDETCLLIDTNVIERIYFNENEVTISQNKKKIDEISQNDAILFQKPKEMKTNTLDILKIDISLDKKSLSNNHKETQSIVNEDIFNHRKIKNKFTKIEYSPWDEYNEECIF